MSNGIFKLDWASVLDALLTAVVGAVVTALVTVVTTAGFSVWSTDWVSVWHNMVNVAVMATVLTLGKDFLSTNNGSLLGIGPKNTPTV